MVELHPIVVFHGCHFVRHLRICNRICVKHVQLMWAVIGAIQWEKKRSLYLKPFSWSSQMWHTHRDIHTHCDSIRQNAMRCISAKSTSYKNDQTCNHFTSEEICISKWWYQKRSGAREGKGYGKLIKGKNSIAEQLQDGRTDWRTDGRVDGRTDWRMEERMDGLTDGRMDGRTNGGMDGRTDWRMDELMDGLLDGRKDEWTDGRTDTTRTQNRRVMTIRKGVGSEIC